MRFVPLLPSDSDPVVWTGPVELEWRGSLHAGWRGREIHAVHLGEGDLLPQAEALLRSGIAPDFLVLPVPALKGRRPGFALLGLLETLLQVLQGRTKIALRPRPEDLAALLPLLEEAQAHGVGFCWSPGLDPEPLAHALWCAVGTPEADLAPLQRLGYRWNVALEAPDPASFAAWSESLSQRYPAVLFPSQMPQVEAEPGIRFGNSWGAE